ncbi:MAG: hypothetical protein IPM45_15255 [Acidimicrobiales bacterium]|nr:hypothetical protein [Acidimicrobiales bacterium]
MSDTPPSPELAERLRRLADRRGRSRRHHPAARSRVAVLGASVGALLGLVGGMGVSHLATQAVTDPAPGPASVTAGDRTSSPSIGSVGATPAPIPRASAPVTQTQGS